MFRNTISSYGSIAKCLHWGMVLLILLMYVLGFTMEEMSLSPQKIQLIGWHKSFGVVVLFLAIFRIIWWFSNPAPHLPTHMGKLQRVAARVSHSGLYLLLLLMPISGWLMSSAKGIPVSVFGWFILPSVVAPNKVLGALLGELHELIAWGMLSVIILHITAALLHHFYYKDTVLTRMLPSWKKQ